MICTPAKLRQTDKNPEVTKLTLTYCKSTPSTHAQTNHSAPAVHRDHHSSSLLVQTRVASPNMHAKLSRLKIKYEVIGQLGSVLEIRENMGRPKKGKG